MLDAYEDAWPVIDLIKMKLKATSASVKRKADAIVNTSKAKKVLGVIRHSNHNKS
jgi:hypothetical protein